jgi:sulfane dehydrogenase subunit SoxC
MTVSFKKAKASRRQFLAGRCGSGCGTVAATVAKGAGDPLITEKQIWAQATGDGVDATPPMACQSNLKRCCASQCGMADG